MDVIQNSNPIIKVGPVANKEGRAHTLPKLNCNQVFFCNGGDLSPVQVVQANLGAIAGWYDVRIPNKFTENTGNGMVVVQIPGYPDCVVHYSVLSESFYKLKYSNDPLNVKVDKVGEVGTVTSPVSVDWAKTQNADAKISLGNTTINYDRDSNNFDIVRNNQGNLSLHLDSIDKAIKDNKPIEIDLKCDFDELSKLLTSIQNEIRAAKKAINDLDTDFNTPLKKELSGIAKSNDITNIASRLETLYKLFEAFKIPEVDVYAPFGGKPLSVKDGCVRIVCGDGPGELLINDGLVKASDVKDRAGYTLGKDGLGRVSSDIIQVIKDEVNKLTPTPVLPSKAVTRSHR